MTDSSRFSSSSRESKWASRVPVATSLEPEFANNVTIRCTDGRLSLEASRSSKLSKVDIDDNTHGSSHGTNSFPIIGTASYKRNVSFRYIHSRSSLAKSQSQNTIARALSKNYSSKISTSNTLSSEEPGSPTLPAIPALVRGGVVPGISMDFDIEKSSDCSFYWKEDARRASDELSQICEEAFNLSSMSTARTTETSILLGSDSSATSISFQEETEQRRLGKKTSPSPDLPEEIYSSSNLRELAETRRRLLEHYTRASSDEPPQNLTEVISHLDRLIEQEQDKENHMSRQEALPTKGTISEPVPKTDAESHCLPIVSEGLPSPIDGLPSSELKYASRQGSLRRIRESVSSRLGLGGERVTIRMVPQDHEVKPLTIYKRQATTELEPVDLSNNPVSYIGPTSVIGSPSGGQQDSIIPKTILQPQHHYFSGLNSISDVGRDPKAAVGKKRSWFSRHKRQSSSINQRVTAVVVHESQPVEPPPSTRGGEKGASTESRIEKRWNGFVNKLFRKKGTVKQSACEITERRFPVHFLLPAYAAAYKAPYKIINTA